MKKTSLSLMAASLLVSFSHADDVKLPTMNLVGEAQDALQTTPGSTTLITLEEIERIQPLSIQDMLKKTPGIHAVETDGYGFYPRITIRGIGSDMSKKVLLLEDGSPIALGPYTDPAAYYHPPVERMERIEVLKGSGSLAHGPSTVGGAINYITKQPKDGLSTTFAAGNFGYTSLLAEYGVVLDDSSYSISALKKEGDGWRDMPFKATDVVAKAAFKLSDTQTVGVKLTHYEHDASHTYLGLSQKEYEENYTQNKAQNDMMFINRQSVDLTHAYDKGAVNVKTLAYYNNATRDWWRQNYTKTDYTVMNNNTDGRLRSFEVMGIDSRLSYVHNFLNIENELQTGIRLHRETMTNKRGRTADPYNLSFDTTINIANEYLNGIREDDTRYTTALALFAQNRFEVTSKTSITPGVRVEGYEQQRDIRSWDGNDTRRSTVTDNTEFIPGIGAAHMLNQQTTLFAGVHKGFAPPRVQDAVSNDGTAVQLEAERSTNYEIGVRGQTQKASYEFTLFRLEFDNQVVQATESGGVGTINTNAGSTLNQGLEAAVDLEIASGVNLKANYTYLPTAQLTTTRIINSVDRNGNRLSYAPEHLANLTLAYAQHIWGSALEYNYVSEQFADLENTVQASVNGKTGVIPAYGLVSLSAWYTLNKNAKLTLAAKNLTDEKYIAARAPDGIMPGMGRNVTASLKVSF